MVYADRLAPHDAEAEEAVCGSLIIDGGRIADVLAVVKPEDFYRAANRWVFEACVELFRKGDPIDVLTVRSQLEAMERLGDAGGAAYLSHLAYVVPTSVHAEFYAGRVAECSLKRQLIEAAGEIAALGYDEGVDGEEAVSGAERLLFKLHMPTRGGLKPIRATLDEFLEEQSLDPDDLLVKAAPIPTGFADLDGAIGRLRRGALYVLAARPSVGKSALAMNIARNAAGQGARVAVFSLEMSSNEVVTRLLSAEAEVDSHLLHLGLLSEQALFRVWAASGELSDMPLYVDDTRQQTLTGIRGECQRIQDGLDLVIIDYLQLMDLDGRRGRGNRVEDVSEITRGLKRLAGDLGVPIIALSQLSRAIEQRPDHYPQLSDLRESGSIEQDADIVMFIHREDRYATSEQWAARHPTESYPENIAQLIIAKNRHGPTNVVNLYARMQFGRFEQLANEYAPQQEPSEQPRLPYAD